MSRRKVPPCAASMGCLCAGHARGDAASKPCDTSETPRTKHAWSPPDWRAAIVDAAAPLLPAKDMAAIVILAANGIRTTGRAYTLPENVANARRTRRAVLLATAARLAGDRNYYLVERTASEFAVWIGVDTFFFREEI